MDGQKIIKLKSILLKISKKSGTIAKNIAKKAKKSKISKKKIKKIILLLESSKSSKKWIKSFLIALLALMLLGKFAQEYDDKKTFKKNLESMLKKIKKGKK